MTKTLGTVLVFTATVGLSGCGSPTPTNPQPPEAPATPADTAVKPGEKVADAAVETPPKVKGVVTYNGKPLHGGNIIFYSDEGAYASTIQSDGTFQLSDLRPGTMTVTIETEAFNPDIGVPASGAKKGPKGDGKTPKGGPEAPPGGGFGPAPKDELRKLYLKIPAKYADKRTSGLRVEVTRGENTQHFELTD